MVDRLLKPAIEMKELQEKYEFSLTLLFGHAIVGLNYDLTVFICVFFFLSIGSLINLVMKSSSRWHMKRAR